MKYITLIFWLLPLLTLAQTPTIEVNFDNCLDPVSGTTFTNHNISSDIDCECGVLSNCALFDEAADTMYLDNRIKDILNEDFTLSMYFWPEDQSSSYSMISVQDSCTRDSALLIKYIPSLKQVDIFITENVGVDLRFSAKINEDRCWHHLVFSKTGQDYSMFLDNEFIETQNLSRSFQMGKNHSFRVGSGPCSTTSETFMRGRIDELWLYDRALQPSEIGGLNLYPDQIITADTTIFEGSSVPILTGDVCVSNFNWTPSFDLDNPMSKNPVASPTESRIYYLNIDHGSCRTQDSIRISVIDENDVQCDRLLLPNVFTPNGDNLNDQFAISNDFIIDDLSKFEIYDRWGAKVFQTLVKEEGWNGEFNGQLSPAAMYVYKIEYTCLGESFKKLGNFSLMR